MNYRLEQVKAEDVDPEQVIARGVQLRHKLKSSPYTRKPAGDDASLDATDNASRHASHGDAAGGMNRS